MFCQVQPPQDPKSGQGGFAIRQGELYVAALDDAKVYRFLINVDDSLTAGPAPRKYCH